MLGAAEVSSIRGVRSSAAGRGEAKWGADLRAMALLKKSATEIAPCPMCLV